jgi:hypothetical protein
MDYNWFFSAFAQCGAAIIGIFGAFIISKIIDINEKINLCAKEVEDLRIAQRLLKSKFNKTDVLKFNKYTLQEQSVVMMVNNGDFDIIDEEQIVFRLVDKCNIYCKNIDLNKPKDSDLYKHFNKLYGGYVIRKEDDEKVREHKKSDRKRNSFSNTPSITNEKENIRKSFEDLRLEANNQHSKFYSNFTLVNLTFTENLQFISRIIKSLVIAFFAIVIYPLHFLPEIAGIAPNIAFNLQVFFENFWCIKGGLLFLFSLVIIILIVVFFNNINRMKHTLSVIEQKIKLYDVARSYSEYIEDDWVSSYQQIMLAQKLFGRPFSLKSRINIYSMNLKSFIIKLIKKLKQNP